MQPCMKKTALMLAAYMQSACYAARLQTTSSSKHRFNASAKPRSSTPWSCQSHAAADVQGMCAQLDGLKAAVDAKLAEKEQPVIPVAVTQAPTTVAAVPVNPTEVASAIPVVSPAASYPDQPCIALHGYCRTA